MCNNVIHPYELPDFWTLNSPDLNTVYYKIWAASLPDKSAGLEWFEAASDWCVSWSGTDKTFVSDFGKIPEIYISQGSLATHLRCGEIYNDFFITHLLLSPSVKEFWKSVNICRSYGQLSTGMFFFMKHCVESRKLSCLWSYDHTQIWFSCFLLLSFDCPMMPPTLPSWLGRWHILSLPISILMP